jgi:hypothetical protein
MKISWLMVELVSRPWSGLVWVWVGRLLECGACTFERLTNYEYPYELLWRQLIRSSANRVTRPVRAGSITDTEM